MVVLGGGVIEALAEEMLPAIVEVVHDYAMPGVMQNVQLIASCLGDYAGVTGGAVLAREGCQTDHRRLATPNPQPA